MNTCMLLKKWGTDDLHLGLQYTPLFCGAYFGSTLQWFLRHSPFNDTVALCCMKTPPLQCLKRWSILKTWLRRYRFLLQSDGEEWFVILPLNLPCILHSLNSYASIHNNRLFISVWGLHTCKTWWPAYKTLSYSIRPWARSWKLQIGMWQYSFSLSVRSCNAIGQTPWLNVG